MEIVWVSFTFVTLLIEEMISYKCLLAFRHSFSFYFEGFSHTDYGIMCDDRIGVANIFTENECRSALQYATSSLSEHATYKGSVVYETEPKGCYVSGSEVYWNTHSGGSLNLKVQSICKSGKSRNSSILSIDLQKYLSMISCKKNI